MTDLNLFSTYAGRGDTDATVILHLERQVRDLRQTCAEWNHSHDRMWQAIKAAGFRLEDRYGEPARLVPLDEPRVFGDRAEDPEEKKS